MRHLRKVQKFHRTKEERRSLKIDLARALIINGQIITFKTRAKWFRSFFERLVTLCKRADGNTQLQFQRLRKYVDEPTARKFIEKIYPTFKDRQGGYVRVLNYHQPFSVHQKAIVSIVEN